MVATSDEDTRYFVWSRHGLAGGGDCLADCGQDLEWAKSLFAKMAEDKFGGDETCWRAKLKEGHKDPSEHETVVLAPVDAECPKKGGAHVYSDGVDDVWDCMLNKTDISEGRNTNKFYLMQLLKDDVAKKYYVWLRWGRVGSKSSHKLVPFGDSLDGAKIHFKHQFLRKTENHWDDRRVFRKVDGHYDLMEADYSQAATATASSLRPIKKTDFEANEDAKNSMLPPAVGYLVMLICDVKNLERTAKVSLEYDTARLPLGKLSQSRIAAGYAALNKIASFFVDDAGNLDDDKRLELTYASSEFYTKIPHAFPPDILPPVLNTKELVEDKFRLLESLSSIQVSMKVLSEVGEQKSKNRIDAAYAKLGCSLRAMSHLDAEPNQRLQIQKFIQSTRGDKKIEVLELYRCDRPEESARFVDRGNRMLLLHGSRVCNWAGILKNGLAIAPAESQASGSMFGRGVYFADTSRAASDYCHPDAESKIALMAVCEVSLGSVRKVARADYRACRRDNGGAADSTLGLGRFAPSPTNAENFSGGAKIPMGPIYPNGQLEEKDRFGFMLDHNEYIVYDPSQIKIRFLAELKIV